MNVYQDFIGFLKNPALERDADVGFFNKIVQFSLLLVACFMISFSLSIIIGIIYQSGLIENEYHAFDELKELTGYKVLLLAAVLARLIEETIFRAPLILFKNPRALKIAFYSLAILFGYVHLFNYQVDTRILLFSPILVAPQMILGLIFGFVRIRLGFFWAVAMHAVYNGILVSLFLVAKDVIQ